jgi:site-specific recombinase XerD
MFYEKENNQRIIKDSAFHNVQDDYLSLIIENFLTDRKTQGLAGGTGKFYRANLDTFQKYCEAQALAQVSEITPDFLRRFILFMEQGHNPGGVHIAIRTLCAFLRWVETEEIIPDWKNPMRKLKAE